MKHILSIILAFISGLLIAFMIYTNHNLNEVKSMSVQNAQNFDQLIQQLQQIFNQNQPAQQEQPTQ